MTNEKEIPWQTCPRCKNNARYIDPSTGYMYMHCLPCAEEIEDATAKLMVEIDNNDN